MNRSPRISRKPFHSGSGAGAFTLLELLVVITLVLALAALLFVVSGRVRQAAQTTRCVNQMRQVGAAWMGFAGENQQTIYLSIEKFGTGSTVQWLRYLIGLTDGQHNRGNNGRIYLADPTLAVCPTWKPNVYTPKPSDNVGYTYGAATRDPNDPYSRPLPEGKTSTRVIRLPAIATPASYWLLTDSYQASNQKQIYYLGTDQVRGIHFRHGDRATTLFADGHVEMLTLSDFAQLPYNARSFGYDEKENLVTVP